MAGGRLLDKVDLRLTKPASRAGIINNIESDIVIISDDTSLFATGSDPSETVEILNRHLEKNSK